MVGKKPLATDVSKNHKKSVPGRVNNIGGIDESRVSADANFKNNIKSKKPIKSIKKRRDESSSDGSESSSNSWSNP